VVDHDEGGARSFAQAEQALTQGGHGAGVVFILIVGGQRAEEDGGFNIESRERVRLVRRALPRRSRRGSV
jgi:hypothetical protein